MQAHIVHVEPSRRFSANVREWIIVWACRRPSPRSALHPSGTAALLALPALRGVREEHGENLFKNLRALAQSVFSVVRKCLAHSFSHSPMFLHRGASINGEIAFSQVGEALQNLFNDNIQNAAKLLPLHGIIAHLLH